MKIYKNKILMGIILFSFLLSACETHEFTVRDECGLIAGQLIHTIADEDQCRQQCWAYCQSKQLEFKDSSFEKGNITLEQCNICNCVCK